MIRFGIFRMTVFSIFIYLASESLVFASPPPPSISNYYKYTYVGNGKLKKSGYDDGHDGSDNPPPKPPTPVHVKLDQNRRFVNVAEIASSTNILGGVSKLVSLTVDNPITHEGIINFTGRSTSRHLKIMAAINHLNIAEGNTLIVRNMGTTEGLKVRTDNINFNEQLSRIAFEVNGRLVRATYVYKIHKWGSARGWQWIVPSSEPWVPAPEPAAYGAIFGATGLGVLLLKRRLGAG